MSGNLVNFYGRDFIVSQDVLIPRPETEQIIDAVFSLVGKPYLPGVKPGIAVLPDNLKILDVGTGSGCIAVTLKLELPKARVLATDISQSALKIAQKNAEKFGCYDPHSLIISNLLENVKFTPEDTPDLIVANLPYVDRNWSWLDQKALSIEPEIALYADDGGLALIKKLIAEASKKNIRYLVLEADPSQHQRIQIFALTKNYRVISIRGFILTLALFDQ